MKRARSRCEWVKSSHDPRRKVRLCLYTRILRAYLDVVPAIGIDCHATRLKVGMNSIGAVAHTGPEIPRQMFLTCVCRHTDTQRARPKNGHLSVAA